MTKNTKQAQQEEIVSILSRTVQTLKCLAAEEQRVTHEQFISKHFKKSLDIIEHKLKIEEVVLLRIKVVGK